MRTIYFGVVLLFVCSTSWGAVLHLNNGSLVTGKIIDRTDERIKMNVNGVTLTYYKDEFSSVDENDAVAPVAEPAGVSPAESSPLPAGLPVDSNKKALILEFINVFGTKDAMTQNLEQMLTSLPPEQVTAFRAAFKIDEIIDLLVPLYDKYFSEQDLKDFIQFYSSSAGRKLVGNIPNIMKESIAVSSKYFEERMPKDLPK